MKATIKATMTWEEAPDTIGAEELQKILGIGKANALAKFDEKGFPRIQGLGTLKKADKEAARLYIQGINIKTNTKEALTTLLLFELKKINTKLEQYDITRECKENLEDMKGA